jgi:hypothetical protein
VDTFERHNPREEGEQMSRLIVKALAAPLLMLAVAAPLAAQQESSWELRLGGGAGAPIGDFNESFNIGWHLVGAVAYTVPRTPLALQVDASYAEYGQNVTSLDARQAMFHGTADLMYQFRSTKTAIEPYVIGGGGVYYLDPKGADTQGIDSRTEFGLNAGAGVTWKTQQFGLFFESRFPPVIDGRDTKDRDTKDLQFNNFTVGVSFAM